MRLPFLYVCIALLCLVIPEVHAQEAVRPNALEEGQWALLFQVDGEARLNFFQGMTALKYHTANQRAWRFGVGGQAYYRNEGNVGNISLTTQIQYLIYPKAPQEVNIYYGMGPQLILVRAAREDAGRAHRQLRLGVGATGVVGVEWFATEHISLLGEYGNHLTVQVQRAKHTSAVATPPEIDEALTDVQYDTSVRLGLAAYF